VASEGVLGESRPNGILANAAASAVCIIDVAVKRHQMLDAIQKASDTGIPQIL